MAEVYERHPATGSVLAEYGLDLCYGGHTLEFAAQAHSLEPDELVATLQAAVVATSCRSG